LLISFLSFAKKFAVSAGILEMYQGRNWQKPCLLMGISSTKAQEKTNNIL